MIRNKKNADAKKEIEEKNCRNIQNKNKKIITKISLSKNGKKKDPEHFVLGDFFATYQVKNQKSFGKSYFQLKKWIFFGLIIKKTFKFTYKNSLRLAGIALIVAVVSGLIPSALSAPHSVSVDTKYDWTLGSLTDLSTENSADSIQLQSAGSWTARTWAPTIDTIGPGSSAMIIDNYLYTMRGYSDKSFWRYDTRGNKWEELSDLPFPSYYGGDMITDGNGNLYITFGGYSKKFYKYNISSESWTQMPDLLDTIWSGSSIGFDGTDVYVVRGNGATDFWKLDVASNSWLSLAPVPATTSTGSNIVYGQNGKFYLTRGANTLTYYQYDISGNAWTAKTNAPTGYNFNGEQKGAYVGGHIYYLRSANTNGFVRYNISNNTWDILETSPQTTNYSPLAYNSDDGLIYALRGNGQYDLWKFDPNAGALGAWVGPRQVMDGAGTIGTGGDLIWNNQSGVGAYVYAIRGGSNAFYRYDLTANTWVAKANLPASISTDTKGTYCNGALYYLQGGNTANFWKYTEDSWTVLSSQPLPATASNGASLACASDNSIYALRGNGTSNVYRYTTAGGWTSLPTTVVDGVTYQINVGGRIATDGTNMFATMGDGEAAFLKYDVSAGSWSVKKSTPFAQYYGTDLTYYNGKIYALAGYYKDETWEYDITSDTWRKLPDNQQYTYARGPYNGASIEYAGGTSLYALTGQALSDMWSYSIGAGSHLSSGNYISQPMDLAQVANWVSFSATESKPANTNIVYETRTSSDSENWSNWEAVSGSSVNSPVNRYIQIKITLTSDGVNTPTIFDYSITYNNEDSPPTNPNIIVGLTQQVSGQSLVSGQNYPNEHPYFNWSGATDLGSGVAGYYVYFGTNAEADPEIDGTFQASSSYLVNTALQNGNYYLRLKTKDNNGNISTETWNAFSYVYSGVSPYLSEEKTSKGDFDNGTLENVSSASVDGSIRLSSISGAWNQTRLTNIPGTVYQGGELAKTTFDGHNYLFTFRGSGSLVFYRYDIDADIWTQMTNAPAAVSYGGYIIAGPTGYLYASQGGVTSTFWQYDIANNIWSAVSSAPKNFTYGASLSFDGSRYIYAFPGTDDAFYKYDTQNNTWTVKPNANFNNPNTVDGQTTYIGSDSDYDGRNNIYVLQGNYYPYFAKFSINDDAQYGETANTWTSLASAPSGIVDGGSVTYDSATNAVYVARGNSRRNFFKYDVDSDTWSDLPNTPAGFSYGASLIAHNGYIYAQRGANTVNFYRFNIAENSWEIPQSGLFGPTIPGGTSFVPYYYGTFMASDNSDNLYLIRGYYDNEFVQYNVKTGTTTNLARLPVGAYDGSSIIYDDDENSIYYVPGTIRTRRSGKNNYFFKYDIATNSWTDLSTTSPVAQTGAGSSMVYDGDRFVYLTQGAGTAVWWKYDTCHNVSVCTPSWSASLPTIVGWLQTTGGEILYKDGYIYSQRGGNGTFWRFDTNNLSWVQFPSLPVNISTGGTLMDGGDGYLYVTHGGNTSDYYRYRISDETTGSWSTVTNIPAQVNIGGMGKNLDNRNWVISGNGTNSYTDGIYNYIIGSEQNGTGFEKTGTYTSESMDLLSVYHWANLTVNYTLPENTFLTIETRTSSDNENWSDWTAVNNNHTEGDKHIFNIGSSPERYIQVKMNFTSADHIFSPKVDDFSINYYQDIETPNNPSTINAYSSNAKTNVITNNTWYNSATPYFEWPDVDMEGGASDNVGGSGVAGYYVCFATEAECVDPFADGVFQTTANYTASGLIPGETYHLKITAIDNAGMFGATSYDAFNYKLDNIAPTNPTETSVTPAGFTAIDNYSFLWNSNAVDSQSGIAKFQYRTDGDAADVWYDISDTQTVSLSLPNENHSVGAYQSGKNKLYLRVVDNAGNASIPITQDYYFSASAPSPPSDLVASPEYSLSNFFSFSWSTPASFIGESSKLKYYYSINTLPTAYNTVETGLTFAGPGPFATQKGPNHFYIVAKDEAGNIDYNLYASAEFSADTSSPGAPVNIQIFDTSDRGNEAYSAALKWVTPTGVDANNFAGYVIYRSVDNINFTQVAITSGTAYVDSDLESKLYYYYVKAKDLTNNLSIASTTVSLTPTGKYTSPPLLVGEPKFTVQSFAANFTWATNRIASSFVEYGKTISLGETNGQVDSVTDHVVELRGLSAGTKYFYRVKYIDQDGNIGTSDISNFTTLPPPVISEVVVSEITLTSAIVSWKTNSSAICSLKYGNNVIEETSAGANHIEKIEGLVASSSYNYEVTCVDGELNSFSSDQYSFSTPQEPLASNITVENRDNVDLPTVVVNYDTNVETTTLVYFKSSDENEQHTFLLAEKTTAHQAELQGLDPAKEYTISVTGVDGNGIYIKAIDQKITTRSDSRPPEIIVNRAIGKTSGRGDSAQANMYIKVETDELTKVKVFYAEGIVVANFEQSTSEDASNTYHLVTIPVKAGQVYSYKVEAYDEARNITTTETASVIVGSAKASATEVITGTFAERFGWLTKIWN